MICGYIRVSAKDQNEARQLLAMREFGVPDEQIVVEKCSGKDFRRPCYQELSKKLCPGDVLVIKSIDRLGRNYEDILEQWRVLTKEKGVDIVVLDMPLLDTRRGRDLMGAFLSDIVLQVLSFVAENERSSICQRQAEGIEAARKRGAHLGRRQLPMPEGFAELAQAWRNGEVSSRFAAGQLRISHQTFLRRAKECCIKRV